MSDPISYRDAGVNIDAANEAVARIKRLAASTFTPQVLTEIGSFGGMFRADFKGMAEPVLVASADGVGTKLRVAFMAGTHNTVGYDLVCHCVNDILVQGARPLFFLDYVAAGKLDVPVLALGGEKSFGTTMAAVMRFAASNVEEGVVSDSGHWIMEENPKATIALVRAFLERSQ